MSLPLISGLLAGVAYLALTLQLVRAGYARPSPERVRRLMLLAVALSAAWGFGVAIAEASDYTGPGHVERALDLLRNATWMAVLLTLLQRQAFSGLEPRDLTAPPAQPQPMPAPQPAGLESPAATHAAPLRGMTSLVLAAVALAAAVQALGLLRGDVDPAASRWPWMSSLGLALLGLVLVEQLYRNVLQDARWAAKPLCLGLATLFVFDVYLYAEAVLLSRLDPDAASIRPLVHLLAVPFLYIAVRRNVEWSRSLQISRRAAFYSAALLLAGGYLLFIAAVGYYVRYFGGEWGRALQLGVVVAAIALLFSLALSASLRARVRVFVGKHFFSYRFDYREEWLAFTSMLASERSPQEVGVLVIRALANVLDCPAGSLWTRTAGPGPYAQTASWNLTQATTTVPAADPFVTYLRERNWIIDLDECRRSPAAYDALVIPAPLTGDERAWSIIPLMVGDELLGWVLLGRPRTTVELDWETRDLVKTASRQAAGYLAQMQATEALLESRKFDAFNRMSAFVVHDLKNIVTQLSLMLKNARRLRDNPEFQEDMLLTIESALEKMRRMMLQLREGATPPEGTRGVELAPIVERLRKSAEAAGRRIETRIGQPLATRGHDERLERVLGHLVQNALDATPPDGRVWLGVERQSGQVRVEVGDTGAGMSEDFIRTRLFKPFSSTKHTGMGIGSYESAQYIRELGGSIEVHSTPGQGTRVSVLLPLLDVQRGSDLQGRDLGQL